MPLLRNLLKFTAGFFNDGVGILLIAFTPDWQRIGDMASRAAQRSATGLSPGT